MREDDLHTTRERLRTNLDRVRARIRAAADRAGRDPAGIRLVAVTKTIPADVVRLLTGLGVTDIGENRVQEAMAKRAALPDGFTWHLIGHLQRNKARRALELFSLLHSVDSARLLAELDRIAAERPGTLVKALLEVNVSGEDQKHGVRPEAVRALLEAARETSHVRVVGLMGMAPFVSDPEEARPCFRELAGIRDAANRSGWYLTPLTELSMGMTNDFEVAVEEQATMVRVGTALFAGVDPGHPTGNSEES